MPSKKKYNTKDLALMTVDALKAICKAQNIPCSNKLKIKLIESILEQQKLGMYYFNSLF
jgi:hypothetical protein